MERPLQEGLLAVSSERRAPWRYRFMRLIAC